MKHPAEVAYALLDTCILSDILRRPATDPYCRAAVRATESASTAGYVPAINELIGAELLVLLGSRARVEEFIREAGLRVLTPVGEDYWQAGEMRAAVQSTLRKHPGALRGRRHLVDFLIAAQAGRVGALVTRDGDFAVIARSRALKLFWAEC